MTPKEYNNQFSQEELESEIWEDIPKHEGHYQASTLGRIRSLDHYNKNTLTTYILYKGTILVPSMTNRGRFHHHLSLGKKHTIDRQTHHLILETFIGFCPKGMEACHNDGNCQNNRLENLRWDTPESNLLDKIRDGQTNKGEKHPKSVLNNSDVIEIRCLWKTNKYSQKDIAKMFSTGYKNINQIILNKTWKHIII